LLQVRQSETAQDAKKTIIKMKLKFRYFVFRFDSLNSTEAHRTLTASWTSTLHALTCMHVDVPDGAGQQDANDKGSERDADDSSRVETIDAHHRAALSR